jgi:hypothetical protein
MTRRIITVVVAALLAGSAATGTAGATSQFTHQRTQHGGQVVRVAAIKAFTLASPLGDYTISVPEGWGFRAGPSTEGQPAQSTENPIMVAPTGQDEPIAFIYGMLPISGLQAAESAPSASQILSDPATYVKAFLRAEAAAMTTRWTAAAAAEMMARALAATSPDTQLLAVSAQSATRAIATVRYTFRGTLLDDRWVIMMVYVLNPAWTVVLGVPAWDSFAFLAGCEAPAGTLARVEPVCAHILTSFRAGGSWLRDDIARYLSNQDQQVQMVQGAIDRVAQMQYQSQLQAMDTNYRVYRGWWKVLGNIDDLRNPETGTTWWNVRDDYAYYCETPQGNLIGGDVYLSLRDSPDCHTMLTRVRP